MFCKKARFLDKMVCYSLVKPMSYREKHISESDEKWTGLHQQDALFFQHISGLWLDVVEIMFA